jgi:hypothetical protein
VIKCSVVFSLMQNRNGGIVFVYFLNMLLTAFSIPSTSSAWYENRPSGDQQHFLVEYNC